MPSTYTTNNGIEKIGTGEQSGTWGDTTNLNFDILDQALDGQVTITATDVGSAGSPNTLPITDGSLSDGRNRLIIITDGGDLGGSVYYQLTPADAEKIIFLRNNLSGSQDLILFQGTYNASRDLIVPAGKDVIIKFSGGGTSNAVVAPVFADLSLDAATIASVDINGGTIDGVTIGTNAVATDIRVDNLQLDGNTLSSTDTDGNVVIAPNGDGDVQLDADTIRVGDSNTDVTITTNGSGDLTLNTNGGTNSGSIEIQDGANTNIIVTANGTGKLELANGDITTSAASGSDAAGQDLTIQAGASTGNAAGGDMIFQTTPAGAGSGSVLNNYTTVLTLTDDSKLQIGTSTAVDSILDEDTMSSDSATALATQQSIKAYVDSQVGAQDTLSEILANGNTTGGTNILMTSGDSIAAPDASGTDQAGTDVIVSGGAGTGTGAGGELLFKVAPAGSTGSSVNALATGMKLDSTKALYVDTINELTSAAGVTIDSVLLKDDVVNATDIETSKISANDGTTAINIADSTGAVDIDTSLNVDGDVAAGDLTLSADAASGDPLSKVEFSNTNFTVSGEINAYIQAYTNAGSGGRRDANIGFYTGGFADDDPANIVQRLKISDLGDITFYDGANASFVYDADTGTTINNNQDARDFTVKSDNNATMLYVDGTNDKVGVGLSSPNPTFHVKGPNTSGYGTMTIEGSADEVDPRLSLYGFSTTAGTTRNYVLDIFGDVSEKGARYDVPSGYYQSWTIAGTKKMTLDDSGRLGINDDTPSYPLDVNGNANIRSTLFLGSNPSDPGTLSINDSSTTAYTLNIKGTGTRTYAIEGSSSGGIYEVTMQNASVADGLRLKVNGPAIFNNNGDDWDFQVKSNNVDNMFYVDAAEDRIGIGESAPDTVLHIKENQSSATSTVKLENSAGGDDSAFSFDWQLASSGTSAQIKGIRTNDPGAGDTDLVFSTSTNGSNLVEAMRITHSGELQLDSDSAFKTDSTATSATTQTAVYSFSATTYTGAKFLVCVTDSTATERYITELLVTHDGTTAVATEYGQVATDTALATFDVDISGGNVRLLATPASSNSMTFKVMSTQLLA